jgi:thiol-disulfide isomerase/thioredoxin
MVEITPEKSRNKSKIKEDKINSFPKSELKSELKPELKSELKIEDRDPSPENHKPRFRVISTEKYIIAGVITLLIFLLGLSLGTIIDNHRSTVIEEINQEQEVRYLSLQSQYLYLNAFSSYDNCPIISTTLKSTVQDLSDSLSKVIESEEEKLPQDRKNLIMRRYLLDNLRYWLLAKESRDKCQMDIVPILYFYTSECDSCSTQGTILTYFKKLYGEKVLVFPINLDFRYQEPMVEMVMNQFNVTKYPTLVIDDVKYEGVVSKEQLTGIICEKLNNPENSCLK